MREQPQIMPRWTPLADAKYRYISYPDEAEPTYRHTYLFDTDERLLHWRLSKLVPTCTDFATAHAHRAAEHFMAIYYHDDKISPTEQAVIDDLIAFPKEDPLTFYDTYMRHVPLRMPSTSRATAQAAIEASVFRLARA